MSAVFSYRGHDGLVILTDGAAYDRDGILRFVERKIDVSTKVPVAVATRGDRDLGNLLSRATITAIDLWGFDEGLRVMERSFAQWREQIEGMDDRYTEILVGGISETGAAQHFVCTTSADAICPTAFEWTDPGRQFCGFNGGNGKPETFTMEGIGLRMPFRGETMIEFFSTVGVGMFEHFRRTRLKSNGCFCVGGHVDMTVIDGTGVKVTRVHSWDDTIGEPIDPWKGQQNIVALPAMSRQQRRATEREARKRRSA